MDEDCEMFKIVVIGNMGTGKTNISTRYIRNEYKESQKSTVGVQFLSKIVSVRNQNIKVTLWDTAGQQRYKSLSKVYYKGASGILIVYDVTNPQSYVDVQSWMKLARQNLDLDDVVVMVVGNKVENQNMRKVPKDQPVKEYKQKFGIDCWEVSAKTGYNINKLFNQLIQRIYQTNKQEIPIQQDWMLQQKENKQQNQASYKKISLKISNLLKIQASQFMQNKQILLAKIQQLIKQKDQALTKQRFVAQYLMKSDLVKQLAQKCDKQKKLIKQVMIQNLAKQNFTYKEVLQTLVKCDMLSNKQGQQILITKNAIIQQNQQLQQKVKTMGQEINLLKKCLQDKNEQINQLSMPHKQYKSDQSVAQNNILQKSINKLKQESYKNMQQHNSLLKQVNIMNQEISKLTKYLQDQKKLKEKLNSMNQQNCIKIRQLTKIIQSYQKAKLQDSFISSI